jgi:hypothetical protein
MDWWKSGGSLNEIEHGCSWKRSSKQSQAFMPSFEGSDCIDPDKTLYFYSDDTSTHALRSTKPYWELCLGFIHALAIYRQVLEHSMLRSLKRQSAREYSVFSTSVRRHVKITHPEWTASVYYFKFNSWIIFTFLFSFLWFKSQKMFRFPRWSLRHKIFQSLVNNAAKGDYKNVAVFSCKTSYRNALAVEAHTIEENLVQIISC